ncbi:MAG: hypothetical protein ACOCYQ_08000 [Alkalispirochaeta sp.]
MTGEAGLISVRALIESIAGNLSAGTICDDARGYPDNNEKQDLRFGMTVFRERAEQRARAVRF